jgi:hypothetical protein
MKNPEASAVSAKPRKNGAKEMAITPDGKNRIMIFGPKDDGTYVVEFKTAARARR